MKTANFRQKHDMPAMSMITADWKPFQAMQYTIQYHKVSESFAFLQDLIKADRVSTIRLR